VRLWSFLALSIPLLAHAEWRYWIEPIGSDDPLAVLVLNDLNNRGEVVGEALSDRTRGFYWRNGQHKDLDPLLGPSRYFSSASSINDRAQIVGAFMDDTFNVHGNLVEGNRSKLLPAVFSEPTHINIRGQDALVASRDPRKTGLTLSVAYKINELGQILAFGREMSGSTIRDRWVLLSLRWSR